MFKINRKVEYALIALKHMSLKKPGQLTTAKEICHIYNTPFDPTSRVLQIMTNHKVLQAEQGAHGGYQIIKDVAKLKLKELTDMIIGPIEIANCLHGKYSTCDLNSSCSVIAPMLNLNQRIADLFETITVKDLIESQHSKETEIRNKPIAEKV